MTKARSYEQHKEGVELAARNAYQSLTDAKVIYKTSGHTLALAVVKGALPIAVSVAHFRLMQMRSSKGFASKQTAAYIRGMQNAKLITDDLAEQIQKANIVCSCGIDYVEETIFAIDACLALLEMSESNNARKRREKATAPVVEPPKRFSFRRWASAAAGLVGLSAS